MKQLSRIILLSLIATAFLSQGQAVKPMWSKTLP